MDLSNAFPSKYLKAADLNGHAVKVIMGNADIETIGASTVA